MTSRRHRVLLLAYYFPPAVGIASERMDSFHRHLPAFGWSPTVLTPREPHYHRAGGEAITDPESVVRTASLELSRGFRKLWAGRGEERDGSVTPVPAGDGGAVLRRLVREWAYVPDAQVGWIPPLLRSGARVLSEASSDDWVVFSSSVPYSSHLAAARLAARFRLPWVAEFRDPWSTRHPESDPRGAFRRELDRRIEESVLREARRVVVTAGATRELLVQAFSWLDPAKVSVVTNGFEAQGPGRPPGPGEPLTLVHAGTLHDPEYVRPLLEAANGIITEDPSALRVVAVGDPGPWRSILDDLGYGAPDWIEVRGVVESDEARDAVRDASVLLLPAPHPRFRRILLGKLLTYLGARRPILGVVPAGSEMEEIMRDAAEGYLVRPWAPDGARQTLLALLSRHRQGSLQSPAVSMDRVAPFTREAQAGRLARILDSALESGRPA